MNPTTEIERRKAIPSTTAGPDEWSVQESLDLYNVEGWGIDYFGINADGHVTVHPDKDPERGIDLFELARDLEAQGVTMPLLLRFSDILRTRIEMLTSRFEHAMEEYAFDGGYTIHSVTDGQGQALPHTIVKTMMRIDLPEPLGAGRAELADRVRSPQPAKVHRQRLERGYDSMRGEVRLGDGPKRSCKPGAVANAAVPNGRCCGSRSTRTNCDG